MLITLTAMANISDKERKDTIIISGNNVKTQKIFIKQDGVIMTGVIETTVTDVSVYPVPVIDNLNISLPNLQNQTSLAIFNMNEVKIYQSNINNTLTTVDMSQDSPGIYFVKIASPGHEIISRKIVKQ
jgi:hypothetical protein